MQIKRRLSLNAEREKTKSDPHRYTTSSPLSQMGNMRAFIPSVLQSTLASNPSSAGLILSTRTSWRTFSPLCVFQQCNRDGEYIHNTNGYPIKLIGFEVAAEATQEECIDFFNQQIKPAIMSFPGATPTNSPELVESPSRSGSEHKSRGPLRGPAHGAYAPGVNMPTDI